MSGARPEFSDDTPSPSPLDLAAARGRRAAPTAPEQIVLPGLRLSDKGVLTRGILRRRGVPLMGYVGLNGSGKSFCMVRDTVPSLVAGRRVLSTVALLDPHTGNPHPLYVPFRHWSQLEDFENGDILLDEVTGVMDSRDSGMPKKVRKLLPQMRRRNVTIRWTGIDWDNSDRRLRQITQAVTKGAAWLPSHKTLREAGSVDAVSMWLPNRLFLFTTYDASTLVASEDSQQITQDSKRERKAKVKLREAVWGPGSLGFKCYDTLDAVDSIDNSCPDCGGRVPEKVCRGHG